jgi:hypothetical protein
MRVGPNDVCLDLPSQMISIVDQLRGKGISIDARPGLSGISREAARAVEQVLIERFGLAKKWRMTFESHQ